MKAVLLVGCGGFLGAAGRFLFSGWVHRAMPMVSFPVGTAAVNGVGCFLIGIFSGLAAQKQYLGPEVRLFLFIGLLGGSTTFSTFAYETVALARDAEFVRAAGNVVVEVVLGLFAAWLGYGLMRP